MKKLLVISALLCSTISFANSSAIKISNLPPVDEDKIFPKVSYAKNPKVANKINTFLQVTLLKNVPNSSQNPFKNVQNVSWTSGHTGFYQWQRYQSPNNILSMKIVGIYTGAGLNDFELIYNFDLRNGKRIDIKDVINKKGVDFVVKTANNNMRKKVTNFIKKSKKNFQKTNDSNKIERINNKIASYEECLFRAKEQNINWFEYYFTQKGITFVRWRCFATQDMEKSLDELGDFNIPISYQKLKPYFTQYGNSLVFNSSKNTQINNPNFKIYQGKIGNYPIHFVIKEIYSGEGVSAYYWYDKYKKLIELEGQFTNNHFSLKQQTYDKKLEKWLTQETMELDLHGNKLTGFWQDTQSKKKLKVKLEE